MAVMCMFNGERHELVPGSAGRPGSSRHRTLRSTDQRTRNAETAPGEGTLPLHMSDIFTSLLRDFLM